MISDFLSIDQILLSFESVLKIEYDERETHKILSGAIHRLENAYNVTIETDLYSLQAKNALVSDNLNILLAQICECLKSMALYTCVSMFNRSIGISLADVNYLGLSSAELRTALKYLQDKNLYEQRATIIPALTSAVTNIDMCTIKRLFIILLLLEVLGVKEGVATIAQYLYLGGLTV